CSSLQSIKIGGKVTNIGEKAFEKCRKLTDVYCSADECPSITTNAFLGTTISKATLHVPANSVDKYKTHNVWGKFMDVVPLTDEELAINNITFNDTDVKDVFDLSGSRINQLKRGVNIIRTKDGKTMKVWVK
ncbi:MAG: leucine-rich repeat domain-containing protein, partial [Bacteroidaceae bacterium]|nr:leucine-rich repeat domain-containing protein [Bacteroidaceae bacterium]